MSPWIQGDTSNSGPQMCLFFKLSPWYQGDNSNLGPHLGCFFELSPLYKGDNSNLGPYGPGFVYELRGWSWFFFRGGCATFGAARVGRASKHWSFNISTFQHWKHFNISTFQHFPPSTFQDFNISAQRGSKEETHSKQHVEMLKC